MATYSVNDRAVAHARRLIEASSTSSTAIGARCSRTPRENTYLESHHGMTTPSGILGLTEGATDETKARYAFVYGDLRRVHRTG